MKTSTAFAILALLAAGSGAVPISRREDGDCPCELLDPNNTVDNAHSVHQDAGDVVPQRASNNAGSLASSYEDKPITLHVPQGSIIDQPTEEVESEDPSAPEEDAEPFAGNSSPAFRLSRPGQPASEPVEEPTSEDDNMMDGADINSAFPDEESVEEPVESAVPVEEQVDEKANGDLQDQTEDEVKVLETEQPVSEAVSEDSIEEPVETLTTPPPSDNNTGSDPITDAAQSTDNVVVQNTGDNTSNHVENLSADPVDHTADTVEPIADDRVEPITNGASSPSSGTPDVDMNLSVRPAQGQSASAQSAEPQAQSQSSPSNEQAQSGSSNPISVNSLRPLAGGLTGPVTGGLRSGQTTDRIRPIGASIVGGLGNGGPVNQVTDNARPLTSGGGLANVVSGGNGLPIIGSLARPQGSSNIFSGAGGLPIVIVNTLAQPQGNSDIVSGAKGLPIVNTLAQPQGTPLPTDTVNGLPVVNMLSQPEETVSDVEDVDNGDIAPSQLRGGGNRLLATKVRPTTDDTTNEVEEVPESLQNGPDGAVDEATDELAKENVKACRECIVKAVDPATSRLSDGSDLVESDPLNVEPAVEPATSRVSSAGNTVQSDPLHVKPATQSPESQLPVSPQCVTAPLTNMPANTMPCLTNYGGRVGDEVDVCINMSQLASRPDYTMACTDEMQDNLGDDLGLLRRDENDGEWDMLNRSVQQYVRLCMVANGL